MQEHLPVPPEGAYWISNTASDRFGLFCVGDEEPDLRDLRELIGVDPVIAEEFDVLE